MFKILGTIILAMALLAAAVPQFTTCESQGKAITLANGATVPMKCKWTARSELAAAVPLLATGALMIFNRRKESQFSLSILGVILGIVMLLIPTYLIGVCQSNMLCHTVMKPVLLTVGSIAIAASAIGLIILRNNRE